MNEVGSDLTEEYRSALLVLQAYCCCDSTSAFKGKEHVKPVKVVDMRPTTVGLIAELGNEWTVLDDLDYKINLFTCAMYGNTRADAMDQVRFLKTKEICDDSPDASKNVDLSVLPSCKKCLIQHIHSKLSGRGLLWFDIPPPQIVGVLEGNELRGDDDTDESDTTLILSVMN